MSSTRIVVIGGTGHFGGRICRRIVGQQNTELVVTSRNKVNADAVIDELHRVNPAATMSAAALDQFSSGFISDLQSLRPDIVIHTAGPYQGQSYRVAEACIEVGSHYIDLADGREFVLGFDALDKKAKQKNVLLVTGASTLPGLSSVVIDSLRGKLAAVKEVEISIAPAHQTPRGRSTVSAVLSYCGMPFQVLVDGEWVNRYGWQNMRIYRHPDLGMRLSGACDVPDLALLPQYVEGLDTVTFQAALEAKWEHIALWLMGWVTRAGIVRNWEVFVPTFQQISDWLIHLGSDVGGMQIKLTGKNSRNKPQSITWKLTARQNHGPEIPCIPALILARKLVVGEISARGAMPCLGMFSMSDFAGEVSDLDIHWRDDESQ